MKFDFTAAYLLPLFKAVALVAVGHFAIVFLMRLIRHGIGRIRLDALLTRLLCGVLNALLYGILAISALSLAGVPTTGLLAALSAVAAALALALKDSLSNIAGGIVLLAAPRFAAGDFIAVDGEEGEVVSVGLICTTLLTYNKRQVTIPNGTLVNRQIANLTREPLRRVDIEFPMPYGTDPACGRKIALAVMEAHPRVLSDDAHRASVVISGYADGVVSVLARAWCRSDDYWNVYYELTEQLLCAMAKQGVDIPYRRLDVRLREKE